MNALLLTLQQRNKYLSEGGSHCPYCDCTDISSGAFEADATVGWQNVVCHNCKAEWQDIWELTGVEELKL